MFSRRTGNSIYLVLLITPSRSLPSKSRNVPWIYTRPSINTHTSFVHPRSACFCHRCVLLLSSNLQDTRIHFELSDTPLSKKKPCLHTCLSSLCGSVHVKQRFKTARGRVKYKQAPSLRLKPVMLPGCRR